MLSRMQSDAARTALWTFVAGATLLLAVGCTPPAERLNSPPQGWSSRQANMQQHYVYMVDNAMLEEMSVSDVHFIPHTSSLNGLGARRLDRYAALLKDLGGQLHYDTDLYVPKRIEARLESVRTYLDAAGTDATKVTVAQGRTGVRGLPSPEGIKGYDRINGIGDGTSDRSAFGGSGGGTGASGDTSAE